MADSRIRRLAKALPHRPHRRLAVVVFTDIVGYTALMQHDEHAALDSLGRFKEVLQTRSFQYDGTIIQYYGDGCLLVFSNALEAIQFAMGIQEDFRITPRIPVRIGLHSGDVVIREGLVYGDTVNMASRIESLGIPGSILVSDAIRSQLRNQQGIEFTALGSFHFKNVIEPMPLFAVSNDSFPVPQTHEMKGKLQNESSENRQIYSGGYRRTSTLLILLSVAVLTTLGLLFLRRSNPPWADQTWENSIAVLPFDDLNADTSRGLIAIGVADEIRNQLASIPSLKVTSRSSCMFFRDRPLPVPRIGESLGAAFVLDGTVQQTDSLVKISLQLSQTETDKVEWTSVYEKKLDDVFDVQEDIALEVVEQLKLDLSRRERKKLEKSLSMGSITYDMYFRAIHKLHNLSLETVRYGESWMESQLPQLSTLPAPVTNLAWLSLLSNPPLQSERSVRDSLRSSATAYIHGVRESKPGKQRMHVIQAAVLLYLDWNIEAAEKKSRDAIQDGDEQGYSMLADILIRTNRAEEALPYIRRMIEMDPLNWEWYYRYGLACLEKDSLTEAEKWFSKGRKLDNTSARLCLGKVSTLMTTKSWNEVFVGLDSCTGQEGLASRIMAYRIVACYASGQHEKAVHLLNELKKIKEQGSQQDATFALACAYSGMHLHEDAIGQLRQSYMNRENAFLEVLVEPLLTSLQTDSKFKSFISGTEFAAYLR